MVQGGANQILEKALSLSQVHKSGPDVVRGSVVVTREAAGRCHLSRQLKLEEQSRNHCAPHHDLIDTTPVGIRHKSRAPSGHRTRTYRGGGLVLRDVTNAIGGRKKLLTEVRVHVV